MRCLPALRASRRRQGHCRDHLFGCLVSESTTPPVPGSCLCCPVMWIAPIHVKTNSREHHHRQVRAPQPLLQFACQFVLQCRSGPGIQAGSLFPSTPRPNPTLQLCLSPLRDSAQSTTQVSRSRFTSVHRCWPDVSKSTSNLSLLITDRRNL